MQFVIIFEVAPGSSSGVKINIFLAATNFEFIRSKSIIYDLTELSVVYFPVPWKRVSTRKNSRSHYRSCFKGLCHAICYLFEKLKRVLASIKYQKYWYSFCYLRLYLGTETVRTVSRLLQRMVRMNMAWNLKNLGQLFQVLMTCLQKSPKKKIIFCAPFYNLMISSSYNY